LKLTIDRDKKCHSTFVLSEALGWLLSNPMLCVYKIPHPSTVSPYVATSALF
jgi:hypothetical protein